MYSGSLASLYRHRVSRNRTPRTNWRRTLKFWHFDVTPNRADDSWVPGMLIWASDVEPSTADIQLQELTFATPVSFRQGVMPQVALVTTMSPTAVGPSRYMWAPTTVLEPSALVACSLKM